MNIVCCAMLYDGDTDEFWTYNNPSEAHRLRQKFAWLLGKGYVLVGYLASAEAESMLSLGVDPLPFRWVDLYSEFRQLKLNSNRFSYGRYLRKGRVSASAHDGIVYGRIGYSVPPSMVKEDNEGRDCTEVGNGLADAVCRLLNKDLDTKHKTAMRDIIIADKQVKENREAIQEYCLSDILYLPALHARIGTEICKAFRLSDAQYTDISQNRGRFAAPVMARIGREGIPFDLESAQHLSNNVEAAKKGLLDEYTTSVESPFYAKQKKNLCDFTGTYVSRYALFEKYIEEHLGRDQWPLTESGRLSQDNNDLKEYDADPNIGPYRQVKKALQALQSFDPNSNAAKQGFVMDSVDPEDNRLRVLFGIFGTMTGRNAPKARRFPFAMGRWARSLIKPPKGWSVGSIDYASQEFMVAASLSGDPNMIAAYESGDPYLYFAQAAGAVPWDGTKDEYPQERKLFKATCLTKDTLVRVKGHGWLPIEKLKKGLEIWDGEQYVGFSEVVYKGRLEVDNYFGVRCTDDHRILSTTGEWLPAKAYSRSKDRTMERSRAKRLPTPRASWQEVWRMVCSWFRSGKS